MKEIKCSCCKKKIINPHPNQKYCVSCGLYTFELRHKISYYKKKSLRLVKKFYGQKSGSERIRWNK